MINVKSLVRRYGDFIAVRGVSFTANPGEIVGFLGPNGAGKTTTLRMITTCLAPSAGTAEIAGYDIVANGDEVRKRIGYLPEVPPLYPEMTVLEFLSFVAKLKGVSGKRLKPAIDTSLEQCQIGDVRARLCGQLSRGYRQRVGLAQAILHDPQVIILDEPTNGLDPQQILHMRTLMRSLAEGRTVLLSTHILPEVTSVCSKVVIMNDGEVVLEENLGNLPSGRSLEEVFMSCVVKEHKLRESEATA